MRVCACVAEGVCIIADATGTATSLADQSTDQPNQPRRSIDRSMRPHSIVLVNQIRWQRWATAGATCASTRSSTSSASTRSTPGPRCVRSSYIWLVDRSESRRSRPGIHSIPFDSIRSTRLSSLSLSLTHTRAHSLFPTQHTKTGEGGGGQVRPERALEVPPLPPALPHLGLLRGARRLRPVGGGERFHDAQVL